MAKKKENIEAVTEEIVEEVVDTPVEELAKNKTSKDTKIQNNISRDYSASCLLNLRKKAGLDGEVLIIIPEGTKVIADGKVTKKDGEDWYSVKTTIKNKEYSGFCVGRYLTI